MKRRSDDGGFALAAAIFALVIVGALVTAGFFAASQETRIGYSAQHSADAFYAAERGLNELIGSKKVAWYEDNVGVDQVVWPAGFQNVEVESGGVTTEYSVSVRHLGDLLYYVESTGRVTGGGMHGGAARRTGMVVRTLFLDFHASQALLAMNQVTMGGNSLVSGADVETGNSEGCDLPTSGETLPGIIAKDTSLVTSFGNAQILGDPPKQQDATLTDDDFLDYGSLDYDQLAKMATKRYTQSDLTIQPAPSVVDGVCNTASMTNWGDPRITGACTDYMPVIHASGNVKANSGGRGQGILLVDGDLHINGGFEFSGIIIVKGSLYGGNGGATIKGTVLVHAGGELTPVDTELTGTPTIQFSSCAVERATKMNDLLNRAVPIGDFSWVDVTAAGNVTY